MAVDSSDESSYRAEEPGFIWRAVGSSLGRTQAQKGGSNALKDELEGVSMKEGDQGWG